MADATIGLPADGAGKRLDVDELMVAGQTVYRERHRLVGAGAAELADVKATDPAANAYGVVTRDAPPVAPAYSTPSNASVASQASADLDSAAIANGKTGKLSQVTVTSSVVGKWVVKKYNGVAETTVDIIMTSGVTGGRPTFTWRPPHRNYATLAGDGAGTVWRVTFTNLDAKRAAAAYAGVFWDEV